MFQFIIIVIEMQSCQMFLIFNNLIVNIVNVCVIVFLIKECLLWIWCDVVSNIQYIIINGRYQYIYLFRFFVIFSVGFNFYG